MFVHYAEKFDWPDLSVSEQRDTGTCRALKDQLAVLSDGTVVPCCLDHEGDVPLGNLFSQELDEILRALPAQALLSGFAARKLTQPLCRRCGYCAPCPNGIDIPSNFLMANYARKYGLAGWAEQRYKAMPYHAGSCVMCGACEKRCPYGLPIRDMLEGVAKVFGY